MKIRIWNHRCKMMRCIMRGKRRIIIMMTIRTVPWSSRPKTPSISTWVWCETQAPDMRAVGSSNLPRRRLKSLIKRRLRTNIRSISQLRIMLWICRKRQSAQLVMVARSLISRWRISTTRIQQRFYSQWDSKNRHVFERAEPSNDSPTSKKHLSRSPPSRPR